MGATYSTPSKGATVSQSIFGGKQWVAHHGGASKMLRHAGTRGQRKCLAKPAYAEPRGFALTVIYGVPQRLLGRYPPSVYSVRQATEDIAACRAGRELPHYRQVVRYDRISGAQDPRVYALTKYHGYTARDFEDPKLLQLLPYTEKDAQIDISAFQKKGRPYYTVIKHTSTVLDPKRGTARNWRQRGFEDRYRYDLYDPTAAGQRVRQLGNRTGARFDASKYPRIRSGGQWVRLVPCKELPAMCRPGDKVFPFADSGGNGRTAKAAEYLEAKKRKVRERRARVEHSKKMDRLTRKMRGLDPESDRYKALARQKKDLRGGSARGGSQRLKGATAATEP